MQSRIVICKNCNEEFDTEAGGMYGYQNGEFTCPPCWEAEDSEPIPEPEDAGPTLAETLDHPAVTPWICQ